MYTTSDLKRGLILEFDGAPQVVESMSVSSPTARGGNTIHRIRLRNLKTQQISDHSFRGGETFGVPDLARHPISWMYAEPGAIHFMDDETYEQFSMTREELDWELKFLTEGATGLKVMLYNGEPIALELPNSVALTITETAPGVKGNSATGRTKPATLETGHVIQIPEHIDLGERVSVDTRTGEFVGRAKG